jgi:hypothetical protein
MPSLNMSNPDVRQFQPSLVLLLWDGFTGSNVLAGDVVVQIGKAGPPYPKTSAEFVFTDLPNGSYTVSVESAPDQPYYLPVQIPVTLPFLRPDDPSWKPIWPGYPDIVLADPSRMLNDPEQTPAYLGQRALATLSPTTGYPFPAGATLVRGIVTAGVVPLNGALVTTAATAQPGPISVVVIDPNGTMSAAQTLTVVHAPVIDSIDPATVIAGAPAFTLTAEGSGFVSGAVLKWNGVSLPTEFLSPGGLAAQVTAAQVATVRTVTIAAVNPDGTASNPQTLTVAAAPSIVSLDPPSVTAGSASFALTVSGSGFAPTAVVELSGIALSTTFVTSTRLDADVSAVQVATAANLNVLAVNPGPPPQASNTQTLAVVSTPVINSLEPSTVVEGSPAFTLNVTGSGFASGAAVQLGGMALTTQFESPSELTAQVTTAEVASVGSLSISVFNPSGPASNAQTLTVAAAPVISSIEPASVAAGTGSFGLVVRGSGFASGAVVQLNGTPLTTIFVDSTELDAHVPRSGYVTGSDGAFVLFFDDVSGHGQPVTLLVSHPSFPNPKPVTVNLQRGYTVSVNIDMSS